MAPATGDAEIEAQRTRNKRRPTGPAEELALRKLQTLGAGEDGGFITSEDLPKFGVGCQRLRSRARGSRRQPRLVRREAEQGGRSLGRSRDARHRRRRDRAHRRAQHPDLGADPDRRRRDRRRRRGPDHRAGDAGGHDARSDRSGRCWPPTGARCRRRWPRRARCSRSSRRRACPGWTRPTRPSCGAPPSGSRATSRACSPAVSRTSRPGRRAAARSPTSRSGTRPRAARRS